MLFCTQCSNIAGRQESLIKIADKDTILISKKKVSIYIFAAPKDQSIFNLLWYIPVSGYYSIPFKIIVQSTNKFLLRMLIILPFTLKS